MTIVRAKAFLVLSLGINACAMGGTGRESVPVPLRDLRASFDSLIAQPRLASATIAVLVVNPRTGDTLYSHNPRKALMPASNQKILTSAVSLAQLGPDFRFATTFATRSQVNQGVLEGDLIVIGRGDPTISDRVHGQAMDGLRAYADSLKARGIERIAGALRPGGNAFPGPIHGYGWEWDDMSGSSAAPVDELLYNEGMTTARVTREQGDTTVAVASRNPAEDYLAALNLALQQRGVSVDGMVDIEPDSLGEPLDTVWTAYSPPLSEVLKIFMKPSQNQTGEVLMRTLALERIGMGHPDSGAAIMRRQLLEWGADSAGLVVYDGSGMSRHNLVTAETIVKVLVAMQRHPSFTTFYESFPIAGVDGTVRTRMRGTRAEGNLRGKTGTLEFVRSLSGYVDTAGGERLVFSFLANHFTVPVSEVTRLQDALGTLLASYGAAQE